MAVTATHLTTASDTGNTASYATASISPTAGRLVLAAVNITGSNPTPTPTVTGCGLTWVQVTQTTVGARTVHLFRARGNPTTGALTIGLSAAATGCAWSVSEFAGIDTSGTNGSGAIVQATDGKPNSTTSASVAFGTAITAGNGTFGAVGLAVQEAPAAGTGWTALGSTTYAAPTSGFLAEVATSGQQNITATWTTTANAFVVGAEIKAAAAVSGGQGTAYGATTATGTATGKRGPKATASGSTLIVGEAVSHTTTTPTGSRYRIQQPHGGYILRVAAVALPYFFNQGYVALDVIPVTPGTALVGTAVVGTSTIIN